MAYNPFNIFRRNQKAIFAVVTVFIMFTFVLSSGLGGGADFFDWLPRWLGQKSRKGEVVCKIDGSKVYSGELDQLRFQRVMANRFMALAAQQALFYLAAYQDEQLRQVTDPEMRQILRAGQEAEQQLRNPQFQLLLSLNPEMGMRVERAFQAYAAIPGSPTAPPAAKEVVRAHLWGMTLQERLLRGGGEQYFVNAPNKTNRDQIDFLLWQKKADQLGVAFTRDDLTRLIQSEFYGFHRSDTEIRKQLQQTLAGFSMDKCLDAIAEEFRVRTAQVAVYGPGMHGRSDKTFGGPPVFNPAYEVFDFYREQTSPTRYEAVAVPAANYIDKGVGEPTEAELKKLYDEYQNQEYDPSLERPGFKIPRKVKLEWVSATGAEPYYLAKAREKLKNEELQGAVSVLGAIQVLGGSPAALPPVARPLVVDPLADRYAREVEAVHNQRLRDWGSFYGENRLLDTSVVRAPTLAAAAGGLAGGQLTLGGPLPGLALLDSAAAAMERRDRIKAGMPLFLGTIPGPSMLATTVAAEASARTLLPKPVPIDAVRAELMKTSVDQAAKKLMQEDFEKFRDALANLSGKRLDVSRAAALFLGVVPGPGMLATMVAGEVAYQKMPTYVADMVAERGWQRGQSTALHDEWTIEEDPGLAPLKAALPKTVHGNRPVRFGQKFFWAETFPGDPTKTPATGTYQPEFYPSPPTPPSPFQSPEAKPEPTFLVWRTEETPAKAPGSLQQVRDQVVAAWKRIKARELARARAEALARAIETSGGGTDPFTVTQNIRDLREKLQAEFSDPKAQERIKEFPIAGIAPLPLAGARSAFELDELSRPISPYPLERNPLTGQLLHPVRLAPTNDIPYPTAEMTKKLLDERTQSAKTTFVIADQPKDTYYVVTVIKRSVKTPEDFREDVYRDILGQTRAVILGAFAQDAGQKTRESVMGLLKKEFRYEETEEQKKRLDENEKRGGAE